MPALTMLQRLLELGDAPAYRCGNTSITGTALAEMATSLSAYLQTRTRGPVMIAGGKQAYMPVCILACILGGIPYIPADSSHPLPRLEEMAQLTVTNLLLGDVPQWSACDALDSDAIFSIANQAIPFAPPSIPPERTCYIMFTSGSSGAPKGAVITRRNLLHFLQWMESLPPLRDGTISTVLGQARFSFDLSVADLHLSLFTGRTEFTLAREEQQDFPLLFRRLGESHAGLAVMTPSFARYCLLDRSFNATLMPELESVFFCGEALTTAIVAKLWTRFPNLRILNAYGPTETTVAVCACEITPDLLGGNSLPIALEGDAEGLVLVDESLSPVPLGERGEILLFGGGVGGGYVNGPSDRFLAYQGQHAYRTGDIGVWRDGKLYCLGRMDRQIKRGGHRIEPEEMEHALEALPQVERCAVLARSTSVTRLTAFVQLKPGISPDASLLMEALAERLPAYMRPDRIRFVEEIPLTANGKCDRETLSKLFGSTKHNQEV